jgi:hypothetical protein
MCISLRHRLATPSPTNESQVRYQKCATPAGAAVTYWKATTSAVVVQYLGQATGASTCS